MIGTAGYWALILTAAVQLVLPTSAGADTEQDARVVHCLSTAHRDALGDAAAALGFDRPADPAKWRDERPAEFRRVCDALYRSAKPASAPTPPTPWFNSLLPFLTGLSGALMAFTAAAWRDRVSRGRHQGDGLRTAVAEFYDAATTHLNAWAATRSPDKVLAAQGKLTTQLAAVHTDHPRWSSLPALRSSLEEGPLGHSLITAREEQLRDHSAQLRIELDRLRDGVLAVARALGRPLASAFKGDAA